MRLKWKMIEEESELPLEASYGLIGVLTCWSLVGLCDQHDLFDRGRLRCSLSA